MHPSTKVVLLSLSVIKALQKQTIHNYSSTICLDKIVMAIGLRNSTQNDALLLVPHDL